MQEGDPVLELAQGGVAGEAQHTAHGAHHVVVVDVLGRPLAAEGAQAALAVDELAVRAGRQAVLAQEALVT